jgi:hypothetical protein
MVFPQDFFNATEYVEGESYVVVKEFFRSGVMPEGENLTSIVLIPKINTHVKLSDYRPISVCSVINKVVSKFLVNRLRPLLDEIISPTQSAFVPGCMITDNALLAFKCIHHIKQEKDPTKEFLCIQA